MFTIPVFWEKRIYEKKKRVQTYRKNVLIPVLNKIIGFVT